MKTVNASLKEIPNWPVRHCPVGVAEVTNSLNILQLSSKACTANELLAKAGKLHWQPGRLDKTQPERKGKTQENAG